MTDADLDCLLGAPPRLSESRRQSLVDRLDAIAAELTGLDTRDWQDACRAERERFHWMEFCKGLVAGAVLTLLVAVAALVLT